MQMRESRYFYFVIFNFCSIISNLLFNPLHLSLSCSQKETAKKAIKDTKEEALSIDVEMEFYTSTPRSVRKFSITLIFYLKQNPKDKMQMRKSRYFDFVILSIRSIIFNLLFNPLHLSLSCLQKETTKKTVKDTKEETEPIQVNMHFYCALSHYLRVCFCT